MISIDLWELDREAMRMAIVEADHRARRQFARPTFAELPVAIIVPRWRWGWWQR